MIDISLLEQLVAFSQCGTLSAASVQLHISQPALSRAMQKLEEQLGVSLFDRQKSKMSLNKNGELAVEYAKNLIHQEHTMIEQIREFDRKQRTISIGACAPILLPDLISLLSRLYHGMTLSSELASDESLIEGLDKNFYQLAILHIQPDESKFCFCTMGHEQLYVFLPPAHPLAESEGLYLRDLDGQTFLLYSQTGFWDALCRREMPSARFLMQPEMEVLDELVAASALPSFTSDYIMRRVENHTNRIAIPILDSEASATYYCTCRKELKNYFQGVFRYYEAQSS